MSSDSDSLFIVQSVPEGNAYGAKENSWDTAGILSDVIDMELNRHQPNFELKSSLFSDISSADDMDLLQCSLEMENPDNRFRSPLQTLDLKNMVEAGKSTKTENKTRWAVNLFNKWQVQRERMTNEKTFSGLVLQMSDSLLNEALSFFVGEVRNEKGNEYRPNTVYEIIVSIQHHFRSSGRFVSFLDDQAFSGMRAVLDAKMKQLSKQGLGLQKRQADIITEEQEETLWRTSVLGSDTPQKLLDTIIFQFGLHFALRAGQEHRNLRFGTHSQVSLKMDSQHRQYLEYCEDVSKTNRGGIQHRKTEPKIARAYEIPCKERCIVELNKKYINARPENCKTDAFYLRPRRYIVGKTWYQEAAVGVHLLQHTVKRLCEEAGLNGNFTNHSLRATAATRLYKAGVDEQLIAEKTGHRSNAIRAYKRTSDEQQADVSDILHGNTSGSNVKRPKFDKSEKQGATELNIQAGSVNISLKY